MLDHVIQEIASKMAEGLVIVTPCIHRVMSKLGDGVGVVQGVDAR